MREKTRTVGCLRADLAASCFLGALPPVDLRAVCLVRAIGKVVVKLFWWCGEEREGGLRLQNEGWSTETLELYITSRVTDHGAFT